MGNIHIHDNTFFHLVIVKKCGFNTIKKLRIKTKTLLIFQAKRLKGYMGQKKSNPKNPKIP